MGRDGGDAVPSVPGSPKVSPLHKPRLHCLCRSSSRGSVSTGSFTGRAGGPRRIGFSEPIRLGRHRHSARPALGPVCGSLSALSLSGKLLCPGRWRAGGMESKQPRGALMKRHINDKQRCSVSAPLPRLSKPRAKNSRRDASARPLSPTEVGCSRLPHVNNSNSEASERDGEGKTWRARPSSFPLAISGCRAAGRRSVAERRSST